MLITPRAKSKEEGPLGDGMRQHALLGSMVAWASVGWLLEIAIGDLFNMIGSTGA